MVTFLALPASLWIAGSAPLATKRGFAALDRRMVGMSSPTLRRHPDDKTLLAIEIAEADGAFATPQDFQRAIDAHIKNIRRKVEPDPHRPRYVLTVHSVGYRFADD